MVTDLSWVSTLTDLNLLALLDVAIDVREAAQLSREPQIAILPQIVRFPLLMPADSIGMRDQYLQLRWNSLKYLVDRGILKRIEPLADPYAHRWQSRVKVTCDATQVSESVVALQAEYAMRLQKKHPGGASSAQPQALDQLRDLLLRFHAAVIGLRQRHDNRSTLEVRDEYDVQDLLRVLLSAVFSDIRTEEWTPSYAGGAARCDFLLKAEQILVEVKKTRPGLSDRQIGDQLLVDIARYAVHPDAKTLVCMVYDPDYLITNPTGLEVDLSGTKNGLKVQVLVLPAR